MINRKWLIASIFVPIWGTVINFILLYIQRSKEKEIEFPKKIFLFELLCGATFLITFIVSGLLLRFVDEVANLNIPSNLGMILAFIIAGLVMNVVFVIYYKRKIENK